jgi:hypothetical protein
LDCGASNKSANVFRTVFIAAAGGALAGAADGTIAGALFDGPVGSILGAATGGVLGATPAIAEEGARAAACEVLDQLSKTH